MSPSVEDIHRPPAAAPHQVACSNCELHDLCWPVGLDEAEVEQPEAGRLDALVPKSAPSSTRCDAEPILLKSQAVARGGLLYRAGDRFEALYAVRSGFFKTRSTLEDGREHVTGFQMAGELLGLDGIGNDVHICDAVALEDSQVCIIPFEKLESLSREFPELQHQFNRIMGREIVRDHSVMLMRGSMHAEERVATFLLNLAERLERRGMTPNALVLRMTRQEIGTYLGLTLETVSRCLSKLQLDGLLDVRHRRVQILDRTGLQALAVTAGFAQSCVSASKA